MIKCTKCGKEIHEEARFCPYCMNKCIKVKVTIDYPKKRKYLVGIIIGFIVVIVLSTVVLIHKFSKSINGIDDIHNDSTEIISQKQNITTDISTTESATTDILTVVPTTEASTMEAPTTEPPTTKLPITELSTTEVTTTEPTTTELPTTEASTTKAPITESSTTEPITEEPTTEDPTTEEPITEEPTTKAPTMEPLTTDSSIMETNATEDVTTRPTDEESGPNTPDDSIPPAPDAVTIGTPILASGMYEVTGSVRNSNTVNKNCKVIEIGILNKGESPIRIFPNATINVLGKPEYERNMKLTNRFGSPMAYVDIAVGETVYVRFYVLGSSTLFSTENDGNITEVYFKFYYGNTIYNGISTAGVPGIKWTEQ